MKAKQLLVALSLGISSFAAQAADLKSFSIAEALATPAAQQLDPQIELKFARTEGHVALPREAWRSVVRSRRQESVRQRNGFPEGLSDKEVCHQTLIQALQELQSRARSAGHKSVERIVSGWTRAETASDTMYTCAVGVATIGIQLRAMPPGR